MNGGSVRKGKPHESSKAKLTWRNECISLCFGHLQKFYQSCAYNKNMNKISFKENK